jgi:hypothetical protein
MKKKPPRRKDRPENGTIIGPILEITDGEGNLTPTANLDILAVLTYPRDAHKREEFMATLIADAGVAAEAEAEEIGNPEVMVCASLLSEIWLQQYGGRAALVRAPGIDAFYKQVPENAWSGSLAGEVLLRLVQMDMAGLPAKVREAVAAVERRLRKIHRLKGDESGPQSERSIFEAWKRYKPAAHLWAAALTINQTENENQFLPFFTPGEERVFDNPYFWGTAECLRWAATRICVDRKAKPVLDPLEMWQLSLDFQIPSDLIIKLSPPEDNEPVICLARKGS